MKNAQELLGNKRKIGINTVTEDDIMNALILYGLQNRRERKTILDSLYCFSKYDKSNHYYYLNIINIKSVQAMCKGKNKQQPLSAIIVHYSALAQRHDPIWWKKNKNIIFQLIKKYDCTKIIIPQDEYNYNNSVKEFITEAGIDCVFTCAHEEDYQKLYPKELGYKYIETVMTGYVDEKTLVRIQKKGYNSKRNIDIGYRARKLPYWLGRHAQLKYELAERFLRYLSSHENSLVYDIANTGDQNNYVILGEDWIDFLLNCRTMLGCLGGAGLLDRDGSIAQMVDEYCFKHPDASFDEVEEHCFKGKDNYIHLFALSPRHFECAMTKTCQVLIEGDYGGVFLPNVDYIEIKRDFSNLPEVIKKIEDIDYCREIAENCYQHVVLSQKYTYSKFVEQITRHYSNDKGNGYMFKLSILCKLSTITLGYVSPGQFCINILDKIFLFLKLGYFHNSKLYEALMKAWHKIKKPKAKNI